MVRERNSSKRLEAQRDESLPPTLQLPCDADDACPILRPDIEMQKLLGRARKAVLQQPCHGDTPSPSPVLSPALPSCPAPSCPVRQLFASPALPTPHSSLHTPNSLPTPHLEIGAGLGRFILARARNNPDTRIIGLEIESVRSARIDVKARKAGLDNIALVCADAAPFLQFCVPPDSLGAIYIFFPDPWPRARHEKNRIFSAENIALAWRALAPGGLLHAATDHALYFAKMREVMSAETQSRRFAEVPPLVRAEDELTDFELKFLAKGMTVNAASWQKLPPAQALS